MKKLSRFLGTVLLLLSCSTVTMATPFRFELPPPEDGEGRYAFTWSGELQGFADDSPFKKFNNQNFTLTGFYFSNGTFEITQFELPNPDKGGSLVALPPPQG